MLDYKTTEVRAADLRPGDMIDLAEGQFFHPADPDEPDLTRYEMGVVAETFRESEGLVVVEFGNIGTAGYDADHVFAVLRPAPSAAHRR